MRKKQIGIGILVALLFGLVTFAALAFKPEIEPVEPAPPGQISPAMIQDGARVVALGDCMFCHTAERGKPFAGGRAVDTPFGAIYSTNITPDAKTGIGQWSLEAFTRALREGVSRDGHLLYPAFPYQHFTRMNDKDIGSVYTYLMSRDPVEAPARTNELNFPFNFRPLVAGWNLLFLDRGELAPDAAQSAEWNLGRYLVDGMAHCAACHTPMNTLGAENKRKAFAGGLIDGWDVPPLNALAGAHVPWTKEQLVSYLRTGLASEHGAAAGPMLPVTRALADAPEEDVQAIATYILSLSNPAAAPAAPAAQADAAAQPAGSEADQGRIQNGATLFAATCASCHGAAAPMSTFGGRPSLANSTSVQAGSPRNVIRLMLDGIPFEGSEAAHFMPSFAQMLTDEQIADVAAYLRVQYSRQPPWSDLNGAVAKIRKETPLQ